MDKQKNCLLNVIGILFAWSASFLAMILLNDKVGNVGVVITLIVAFGCGFFLWKKTIENIIKKVQENNFLLIIPVLITIIFILRFYQQPLKSWTTYLSAPALIYLSILMFYDIRDFIKCLYNRMDKWDKKAYIITSGIGLILITILYLINNKWYWGYDIVYSMDSGWFFNVMPIKDYYQITHPILEIFLYPVYTVVDTISFCMFYSNNLAIKAIIYQYINFQLLVLTGLELKQMTKNKYIFCIYMLSYPTIISTFFMEKYPLCVFLLCTYVYQLYFKNKGEIMLCSATGVMPTSGFIGITEIFTQSTIKEKAIKIGKIILMFCAIMICLGRINIFTSGLSEMSSMKGKYDKNKIATSLRVNATTKMMKNSIYALPSSVYKGRYLWNNLMGGISFGGLAILGICIIGFAVNRKEIYTKAFGIWTVFSCILFVILNWSVHETPLFTIYFSWAIIPLLVMGIDYIMDKMKLNKHIVYILLMVSMFIVNTHSIVEITKFLFTT